MDSNGDYLSSGRTLVGEEAERVRKMLYIPNEIKEEVARIREYALPSEEERRYLGINT